ncbi:uncharacterized protein LOC118750555 isoform X2 [Rhagoletis pomonella]|uniref:uncharacterized protein LOC118750555 isoform X2 n=1 Tax=Rhagoletis pomonella TaxID=28610 RepID=UPI001781826C|nr:uncharacterized protein LOC118750555 isoform X2 [Rhagoletis pomonella]
MARVFTRRSRWKYTTQNIHSLKYSIFDTHNRVRRKDEWGILVCRMESAEFSYAGATRNTNSSRKKQTKYREICINLI